MYTPLVLFTQEKDREKLYAEITNTPGVVWAVCVLDHEVNDTSRGLPRAVGHTRQPGGVTKK